MKTNDLMIVFPVTSVGANYQSLPSLGCATTTLGVRTQTTTTAVYAETGRVPLFLRHQIKALKYWAKILNLSPDHPVKKAYSELFNLHSIGQKNWCTKIKTLLRDLGFINAWNVQRVVNVEMFTKNIWETMLNTYKYKTMESIKQSDSGTKLRTYKLFKDSFGMEPYLTVVKDPRYRTVLSRLRLSSHNLAVETGRHVNPKVPLTSRLCENCSLQNIEDELHFLLVCPKYASSREKLISELSCLFPNVSDLTTTDKFKFILQCEEQSALTQLGKYVYENFQRS